MPFDQYEFDPSTGGVIFSDSSTGGTMLTTHEAALPYIQDIDARRATLAPNAVPETTGVAYSTELPPMVPPKPSLFDEGSMALAQAKPPAVVDLGDFVIEAKPGQPVSKPDVAVSTAAERLQSIGAPVNAVLASGPSGTPVTSSEVPPTAGIGGVLEAEAAKVGQRVAAPPPQAAPMTAAGIVKAVKEKNAPPAGKPAAPTTAPAPGAAAAPPRIVRTENAGAEAAKPPEPPQMVTAQVQDTTASQKTNARSTQETINRELGPSPQARKELFDAWVEQGKITADQRDLMARGEYDKAGLTFEQGQFLRDSAIQSAVRIRDIENRNQRMAELSEGLSREVAEMRVDPARMWKNASTGEKIQLGIAALLGAWGSALQGRQDNAGVKIIDDAIKRDVDLQMQDIASKRELATDAQRLTKMMIDNGASLQQARNAMTSMMMDSVIMRADSLAKRGSLYRPEDLDATGQPKPGTRSFAYAQAIADLRAKKAETDAKFSAAERGTVQRAVKNEVQTAVTRTVGTTTVPTAPAASTYAGLPIIRVMNEDGKMETLGVRNIKGVDVQKLTQNADGLNVARQSIPGLQEKLNSLTERAASADLQAAYGLVKSLVSQATGQGAMTADEQRKAESEITSLVNAKNVVKTVENFIIRKQRQIKDQTAAYVLTPEQTEEALRGQKAEAEAKARGK